MNRTVVASARIEAPAHPRIYFIRHGETDWNREGRLQGQHDIALNDLGRRQAAEVASHLRDTIGSKTRTLPWIASPMARVMETMRIARNTLGLFAQRPNGFSVVPVLAAEVRRSAETSLDPLRRQLGYLQAEGRLDARTLADAFRLR